MAGRKLTVVISQAPGKNPTKRQLEEDIATQLMLQGVAEVSLIPHLYDLAADHTGMVWLKGIRGDMVVLGWSYGRAIRWVLDRNGIRGQEGLSLLKSSDEVEEDDEPEEAAAELKGIGSLNVPKRKIYAIDLRDQTDPNVYIEEIRRIASEAAVEVVSLGGLLGSPSGPGNGHGNGHAPLQPVNRLTTPAAPPASLTPLVLEGTEPVRRRWYPVIDYSRCTNCMECIDFCLFGVYGVDNADRILVEQQDNCKKGCPACSRVCPENAIIFPEHKTPSIAGAAVAGAGDFKIDLSKLFGAPDALEIAVLERDRELVADGRDAVGTAVGLPKRQEHQKDQPRDSLDDLMDGLDALDL